MYIVLLKCQIAFLKFTSCDNQDLVGFCSNCCCSCSFEPKIIEIGQTSHKIYKNKILNFQESMTILIASTKKVWKLIKGPTYFLLGAFFSCYLSIQPFCYVLFVFIFCFKSVLFPLYLVGDMFLDILHQLVGRTFLF